MQNKQKTTENNSISIQNLKYSQILSNDDFFPKIENSQIPNTIKKLIIPKLNIPKKTDFHKTTSDCIGQNSISLFKKTNIKEESGFFSSRLLKEDQLQKYSRIKNFLTTDKNKIKDKINNVSYLFKDDTQKIQFMDKSSVIFIKKPSISNQNEKKTQFYNKSKSKTKFFYYIKTIN